MLESNMLTNLPPRYITPKIARHILELIAAHGGDLTQSRVALSSQKVTGFYEYLNATHSSRLVRSEKRIEQSPLYTAIENLQIITLPARNGIEALEYDGLLEPDHTRYQALEDAIVRGQRTNYNLIGLRDAQTVTRAFFLNVDRLQEIERQGASLPHAQQVLAARSAGEAIQR